MSRLFAFSLAILTLAGGSALAQPPALVQGDVTVRYDDLDLNRPQDARQMLERLTRAASAACGNSPYLKDPHAATLRFKMADFRKCRSGALANAVTALHAPVVERLYAQSFAPATHMTER